VGVTLHFEGRLKDDGALSRVVAKAKSFAVREGWATTDIHDSNAVLRRVRGEQSTDYRGPAEGVVVSPHIAAEPLRLEFDQTRYVQDYIKTQFAPAEIHVKVVELLRSLESEFDSLCVFDEGEFWESSDVQALRRHMEAVHRVLTDVLAKNPNAHGPVRLPSGRIVDYMS